MTKIEISYEAEGKWKKFKSLEPDFTDEKIRCEAECKEKQTCRCLMKSAPALLFPRIHKAT